MKALCATWYYFHPNHNSKRDNWGVSHRDSKEMANVQLQKASRRKFFQNEAVCDVQTFRFLSGA